MLTLEQTLRDQENLEALCADRPLVTKEIFGPNAFYGIDFILKQYVGLHSDYALKAVIPHGVYYDGNYLWEAEKIALVPAVLCYSPFRRRVYATQTEKLVVPSASPFMYLQELMKGQPRPERKGMIFFPAHSTHHITAQMDIEGLADKLLEFGREYEPVTVCIYWRDFHMGRHIPFEKRGMRIVSAGHMFDPHFLYRFYHLCSLHSYAASNEIGSNLFYSVRVGCSFFLVDTAVTLEGDEIEQDLESRSKRPPHLRELFSKPEPAATEKQRQVVDFYLGSEHLKSPGAFKAQLRYLEFLDRFGVLIYNKGFSLRLISPYRYRRKGLPLQKEYLWIRKKLSGLKRKIRYLLRS